MGCKVCYLWVLGLKMERLRHLAANEAVRNSPWHENEYTQMELMGDGKNTYYITIDSQGTEGQVPHTKERVGSHEIILYC